MSHYAGLSLYAEQAILDADAGDPWEMPASLWLALDTTEADSNDQNYVEVTGENYVRMPVTLDAYDVYGRRVSSDDIIFPAAGVDGWGTIVAFRVMDNSSPGAGNIISRGPCDPKTITSGQEYAVYAGNLIISLSRTVT